MIDNFVLLVAGLIGEESVQVGDRIINNLGGSGCYAALGASLFCPTQLIGVTAESCLDQLRAIATGSAIDISQLQICPGRGFRYAVSYEDDNHTLHSFQADWGMSPLFDYAINSPTEGAYLFLAADDPARQLRFARRHPNIVYGLGINEYFIPHFQLEYKKLIANAKLVVLNRKEYELLQLKDIDEETMLLITDGPRAIDIHFGGKRFEQGFHFEHDLVDPTGCGDVLGGAFFANWVSEDFATDHLPEIISRSIQVSQLALVSRGALGLMKLRQEAAVAKI